MCIFTIKIASNFHKIGRLHRRNLHFPAVSRKSLGGMSSVQVMDWCLFTSRHSLNQCWLTGSNHGEQTSEEFKLHGHKQFRSIKSIMQNFGHCLLVSIFMMTLWNGNIFRVTGHLCGEFTGPRWIPHTEASDTELWCFFDLRPNKRLSKQWWGWWFETPSCPLWRHCNVLP